MASPAAAVEIQRQVVRRGVLRVEDEKREAKREEKKEFFKYLTLWLFFPQRLHVAWLQPSTGAMAATTPLRFILSGILATSSTRNQHGIAVGATL